MPDASYNPDNLRGKVGHDCRTRPTDRHGTEKLVRRAPRAWDPVEGRRCGSTKPILDRGYDGGVMRTRGNLVFRARAAARLVYAADSRQSLKAHPTGSHIMAAPTTYTVNGDQYVCRAGQVMVARGHYSGPRFHRERGREISETQPHHCRQAGGTSGAHTPHRESDAPIQKPPERRASQKTIMGEGNQIRAGMRHRHVLGPA